MTFNSQKITFISLVFLFISVNFSCAQNKSGDTFRVFYLGGQSNMEGHGYTKDLPADLTKPFKDVYIFHGNPIGDGDATGGLGKWEALRPGHGSGFVSDGKANTPSDRFGIEMRFAKRMRELYPNDKIAIIKYARNGSTIDSIGTKDFGCWEPDFNGKGGINQYDYFLRTMASAMETRDINSDGKDDNLIPTGILWMQGEGDGSYTEAIASQYYNNLKRLMDLFRAALHKDDLPVVVGKISDSGNAEGGRVWKFGELVQYAEEKYAKNDGNAAIVRSTSKYKYSDPWHYDSAGYLDFGLNFAEAMHTLLSPKAAQAKE